MLSFKRVKEIKNYNDKKIFKNIFFYIITSRNKKHFKKHK